MELLHEIAKQGAPDMRSVKLIDQSIKRSSDAAITFAKMPLSHREHLLNLYSGLVSGLDQHCKDWHEEEVIQTAPQYDDCPAQYETVAITTKHAYAETCTDYDPVSDALAAICDLMEQQTLEV